MATLVANGNRSVMSPAYADTNDGYFEHVDQVKAARNARTSSIRSNTGFMGSSKTFQRSKNNANSPRPMIYGPSTVYVDGEAYPNTTWARKRVHPREDPDNRGEWIDPDRYDSVMAYRAAKKNASGNISGAVSGGINKVTGIPGNVGKALKNSQYGQAATRAAQDYDREHTVIDYDPTGTGGTARNTENAFGRTWAMAKAVAKTEADNIYRGAMEARNQYRINNYNNGKKGNAVGEALATARGAIGSSAVGRAGKAAFEALKNKAIAAKDDFMGAINKYLTGDGAKANRSKALKDLQTKAGNMMSAVRAAFGTEEGRASTLGKLTGTASGLAAGIAQSNVGKAAISAGRTAYNAVGSAASAIKNRIGDALSAIGDLFKKKSYKNASTSSNSHLQSAPAYAQ